MKLSTRIRGALSGFLAPERRSVENPSVPISSAEVLKLFGIEDASGERLSRDQVLGLPPVWCAVSLLAGELASLPLAPYRRAGRDVTRETGPLADVLGWAPTDELTSFDWRLGFWWRVFAHGGRAMDFIERNPLTGRVVNIWPTDPRHMAKIRRNGQSLYELSEPGRRPQLFDPREIIDLVWAPKPDGIGHLDPLALCRETLVNLRNATRYGGGFFGKGAVPPFVVEGPFTAPGAIARAGDDIDQAIRQAIDKGRNALALPRGHTMKSVGVDPEKAQLVELQQFLIVQIARIYGLPPVFLQDLSNSNYSNVEQQDLHLAKHVVRRWADQFEAQLGLKLFGRRPEGQHVRHDLNDLLRGDLGTRMTAHATAIQNAILTPDEVREMEGRPQLPGGDKLLIQGATVPVEGQAGAGAPNPEGEGDDD